MLCLYGAYVGPVLIHVRLLEAMLRPSSSHVCLLLRPERRVPYALEIGCGRVGRVSIPPSVWVCVGELSSQSEKSIERYVADQQSFRKATAGVAQS